MAYKPQYWNDYDETKTETQNIELGAVVTSERMNTIENGIVENYSILNKEQNRLEQRNKELEIDIANTQSGFLGEFYSEAELNKAYPKGAKGYAVIWFTESKDKTGYTYTYISNKWKKGNVWNGMGIADGSVSPNKIQSRTTTALIFPYGQVNYDTKTSVATFPTFNLLYNGSLMIQIPETDLVIETSGFIVVNVKSKLISLKQIYEVSQDDAIIGGNLTNISNGFFVQGNYTIDNGFNTQNNQSPSRNFNIWLRNPAIPFEWNPSKKTFYVPKGLYFNAGNQSFSNETDEYTLKYDNHTMFVFFDTITKKFELTLTSKPNSINSIQVGYLSSSSGIPIYSLNIPSDLIKIVDDNSENKQKNWLNNIDNPIMFFGDSITQGVGGSGGTNYPDLIKQITGWEVINKGVSGATWQNDSPNDSISFVNRAKTIDFKDCKSVVFWGSTNDYFHNLPIGEIDDTTENTLYGAINTVLNKVYSDNVSCQVAFITPMFRSRYASLNDGKNSDIHKNSKGLLLDDYCQAIKNIAKKYHVPVYDAYNLSGINIKNSEYFLADGLHPNNIGYLHLAKKIGKFVTTQFS